MSPYRRRATARPKPRTPWTWLAIILLVAAFTAALLGWGGGAIDLIEGYFRYEDTSYRPLDSERFREGKAR
jgi:hypothetical protein